MKEQPVYNVLANKCRLLEQGSGWYDQIEYQIESIMEEHFPSGSGFDSGCTLNLDDPKGEKLIIDCPYHCMNDNGFYDGWVYPSVIITPSLCHDYNMRINWKGYGGKYKFLLDEYIGEVFTTCLDKEIDYPIIKVDE